MQDDRKAVLSDARHVALTPEDYLDDPAQFVAAWAAMKAGRGQGFDPARLRPMHIIVPPGPAPEPTEHTLERTGQKIRAVIEARGYAVRRDDAA